MKFDIPTIRKVYGDNFLKHRRKPITLKVYDLNPWNGNPIREADGSFKVKSVEKYIVYTNRKPLQHESIAVSRFIADMKRSRPDFIASESSVTTGIGKPEIVVSFRRSDFQVKPPELKVLYRPSDGQPFTRNSSGKYALATLSASSTRPHYTRDHLESLGFLPVRPSQTDIARNRILKASLSSFAPEDLPLLLKVIARTATAEEIQALQLKSFSR